MDYLNEIKDGVRKIFSEKGFLFNLGILGRHSVSLLFYFIGQKSETFLIFASQAYHGGLSSGLNITSAVNYADSSLRCCALTTSKSPASSCVGAEASLPIERLLWTDF